MRVQLVGEQEDVYLDIPDREEMPKVIVHKGRAYLQGTLLNLRDCYYATYTYFTKDGTYDQPD